MLSNSADVGDPGTLEILLSAAGIQKAFPGVQAIGSGELELRRGEIHALVGENGAGKSTLIKVLTGVHQPDAGTVSLSGQKKRFNSPVDAHRNGITAIYQELSLVPNISVSANLFLGREPTRGGLLRSEQEIRAATEVLARLGLTLDVRRPVGELSISEQQLVEIARALITDARIIIMDEPTAALTPREVTRLFAILRGLTRGGIGIIFVSHRLEEVLAISDRVTVMRYGFTVATRPTAELSQRALIELMVGRVLEDEFPPSNSQPGATRLSVRGLSGDRVHDVSFDVHSGEILGIAGLMGAGRTELARLIFGADRRSSGKFQLDGRAIVPFTPREAIRAGIGLLNEDRKRQGLVLCAPAVDSFALTSYPKWSRFGLLNLKRLGESFQRHVKSLAIKIAHPLQRTEFLSGGNQQKLLVARWLETDSQVLIFDEPTRGIDVGAKYEMYVIIRRLAAAGKAIILISSDLPEILGMCDRVLVMKAGRIAGEVSDMKSATQEMIMALAV